MCTIIFDEDDYKRIIDTKSIKKEDQIFVKERMKLLRRINTQHNVFLETYKLFENTFVFKGKPLKDFIDKEIERTDGTLK